MVLPILAAVAGGAISAIGSNRASRTAANASRQATDAQLAATRETNNMLRGFRAEDIKRFDPYYQQGLQAQDAYAFEQGFGDRPAGYNSQFSAPNALAYQDFNYQPFEFTKDPGYDFRMQEGREAVLSSAAARQGAVSGAAGKALARYGQDYASNEYDRAYGRYMGERDRAWNQHLAGYDRRYQDNRNQMGDYVNYLGRLQGVSASGQNAAGMQGAASMNYGGQIGQNTVAGGNAAAQGYANVGNAQAAGAVGMANAFTGGINNALGAYQYQNLLNRAYPQ